MIDFSSLYRRVFAMTMQVQQLAAKNACLEEDKFKLRMERSELSGRLSAMEREVGGCGWVGACAGVGVHG